MNPPPATQERIWAVLAHLAALLMGMGIVLPVAGWSDQRRKSAYASFQCLQALGYQSVGFTVWVLSYLLIVAAASLILLAALPADRAELQGGWIVLFTLLLLAPLALYLILPLIAAAACALGRDFRYPVLGDRLARYLGYEGARQEQTWLDENHEFHWVAAMGHFSVLIVLWGMLAPLTAWALQGRHSPFLKFQSIQALAYQAIATVTSWIGASVYFFGLVILLASMGAIGRPAADSSATVLGLAAGSGVLLISFVLLLVVPLLHILGQWAGYRVLRGDDYRYPLLGRLVERWVARAAFLSASTNPTPKGNPR